MKFNIAVIVAVFLHSQLANGMDPTYDELKNQLPINVNPNGDDQYFFFIVPVQKNDEPNVILQMAQAQSSSDLVNGSFATTVIDTGTNSINSSVGGEDIILEDIFKSPEESDTNTFNFQVPVVVPLDFRFKYDPATASDNLPVCSVDSRTWKERVISKIAEKLELPCEESWDHTDLNVRIRLKKDAVATVTSEDLTTVGELSDYVTLIHETKIYSDIRYSQVISGIIELKAEHMSLIAEGLDTYVLIANGLQTAKDQLAAFKAADPSDIAIAPEELRISTIESGLSATIQLFSNALRLVKELQAEEDVDEEES